MTKNEEPLTLWVVLRRLCMAFLQGIALGIAWGELERFLRKRDKEQDKSYWHPGKDSRS